jgi:hypothetical protein
VELQEFDAKHAQFKVMPRYKVKAEGDVVCTWLFFFYSTDSKTKTLPLFLIPNQKYTRPKFNYPGK